MTIRDIAELSGFSVGTVSRVLNDSPNVSEKTREKILKVVEENHFEPNSYARTLKQHSSNEILVIVKGFANTFMASLLESMQMLVEEKGFSFRVSYINENDNEVLMAKRQCDTAKPQGIIFLGSSLPNFEADFNGITIPCIIATNSAESLGYENLSSVATDDRTAARIAMEYLFKLGHQHIGILGGRSLDSRPVYQRYKGIREAFEHEKIPFDPEKCYEGSLFSLSDGYTAMNRLVDRYSDMTAVFAMSDLTAIGAMRALEDRNINVPEEISVFGFDGIEYAGFITPRLTTIRQNREVISRRSVEILVERIEDPSLEAVHEIAPFRVNPGESISKPAPARGDGSWGRKGL